MQVKLKRKLPTPIVWAPIMAAALVLVCEVPARVDSMYTCFTGMGNMLKFGKHNYNPMALYGQQQVAHPGERANWYGPQQQQMAALAYAQQQSSPLK